jgi:hypothetical protein
MTYKKDGRVLVGHIGVDAGLCWIGDPCYILHKDKGDKPAAIGKDWGDFCDTLGKDYPTLKSYNYDMGHEGLGVCVSTGYGDGCYPVFATIKNGRVAKVTVDFENVIMPKDFERVGNMIFHKGSRKFNTFEVYCHGKHIDTVEYLLGISAEDVRNSLINHDGYARDIEVLMRDGI